MARPNFEPTEQERHDVRLLAGIGTPQKHIAEVIDVAPKTLRKHFRKELNRASDEANVSVSKTLFHMATSGKNASATIFWMKTRCGWREKPREEKSEKPPKEHRETDTAEPEPFSVVVERTEEL